MPALVLLRHGQSTWNADNRFTGWVDVDLSPRGEEEARLAGELLTGEEGLVLDVCHTSVLTRATRTAEVTLHEAGLSWLPVYRSWRLNERHYGGLQGLDKSETTRLHGADQVKQWRRSFDIPPPPLGDGGESERRDRRYRFVPPSAYPVSESLADVVERLSPYYEDVLLPDLLLGRNVIVVAHGNSLRALIYRLEGLTTEEIVSLEVPTGFPRVYDLDDDLNIRSARYLGDAATVAAAADAVARQADAPPT